MRALFFSTTERSMRRTGATTTTALAWLLVLSIGSSVHAFAPPLLQRRCCSLASSPLLQRRLPPISTTIKVSGRSDDTAAEVVTTPRSVLSSGPLDISTNSSATPTGATYQAAIRRTLFWVGAACAFGGALWLLDSPTTGEEFFAGYLVEQSLSVDNLFVFLILFDYFQIPSTAQNRILSWGIGGAMVMRAIMIGLGVVALQSVHAILLVFAAILIYSSAKILWDVETDEDPGDNPIVQFAKNLIPSTDTFDNDNFFTVLDGVKTATPVFICMIAVEISDIVFAVDSIPAVFGVTENPLVVFTSNIFAIMGLRSLYTVLSKAATDLKYLEPAVALVLGFIGSKMIAEYFGLLVPTNIALAVVASLLGSGIGLSLLEDWREASHKSSSDP